MVLFAANISFKTSEKELDDLFSQYGKVQKCKLAVDKETGRSKGYAFIEMEVPGAIHAMSELENYDLNDRPLKVREAEVRNK